MRGSPEPLAWRSRLELLESASPIAFAEHPHFSHKQSAFQWHGCQPSISKLSCNPRRPRHLRITKVSYTTKASVAEFWPGLSNRIVRLAVRILEQGRFIH